MPRNEMKRKALEIAFELFARFNASQCSALNRRYTAYRYMCVRNVGIRGEERVMERG